MNETLTARELEILRIMARGKTHQEVASMLGISLRTVKTHASNIYSKLHVRFGCEAIVKAHLLGLVQFDRLSPVALAIEQLLKVAPGALDELVAAGIVRKTDAMGN